MHSQPHHCGGCGLLMSRPHSPSRSLEATRQDLGQCPWTPCSPCFLQWTAQGPRGWGGATSSRPLDAPAKEGVGLPAWRRGGEGPTCPRPLALCRTLPHAGRGGGGDEASPLCPPRRPSPMAGAGHQRLWQQSGREEAQEIIAPRSLSWPHNHLQPPLPAARSLPISSGDVGEGCGDVGWAWAAPALMLGGWAGSPDAGREGSGATPVTVCWLLRRRATMGLAAFTPTLGSCGRGATSAGPGSA